MLLCVLFSVFVVNVTGLPEPSFLFFVPDLVAMKGCRLRPLEYFYTRKTYAVPPWAPAARLGVIWEEAPEEEEEEKEEQEALELEEEQEEEEPEASEEEDPGL